MSKGTVIVLGCGPAGLMSAQAAFALGYEVEVFSKKRKSEMFGAQYLHEPIPDVSIDEDKFEIQYVMQGSAEQYRAKVYGGTWDGTVSPEDLDEDHDGWDIRAAYNRLWDSWHRKVNDIDFNTVKPAQLLEELKDRETPPVAYISSVPAPLLCLAPSQHAFSSKAIWTVGDAPERGIFCPVSTPADNMVVCNGDPVPGWYRAASVQGYRTAEWPEAKRPPVEGVSSVLKPLNTTCTCLPEVHRVGRYGKWEKGVLSHQAYFETWHGLGGNS